MAGGTGQLLGGRYRLVEPVGAGGMGQVWRGHDEILEREVAVKEVLQPEGLPGPQRDYMIARTMREARAAARLHHPGIVLVYDAIQREGVPWIVMEFISGPSLAQAIADNGRLAWERVAALGRDLADALAHAHAAGVVHRDLKPANVLLAGHRTVLTDFGVARVLDATTQLTSTGAVIGTPHYMSPEQIEGDPVQAPADLWALGATLYHAAEGCPPFDGPSLAAVLAAILTRPPPAPRNAGPLTPVLYSLLTKAPGQRPSAAALISQLTALLGPGQPNAAIRSPATASPSGPATVALAARRATAVATAVLTGHSGRVYSVAFSPDGSMLATGNCYKTVRLWDVATRTCVATLTGHSGWVHSVAFSPDGSTLATGSSDHTVRLWDTRTRTCTAILTGHSEIVREVAFSPDGAATLASASADNTIRLWDVSSRTCIATLADTFNPLFSVAFGPDGATLASGGLDNTVRLWDVGTRTCVATLTGHQAPVASVAFSPDGTALASSSHDKTVRLWQLT